ncbi:uncharacterized protein XB5732280.S [Xenopus laevis]|uniref:Spermatogenesis-associated protein 2 PUB-like domain-containing protein n=2 Tax=Xenopus laevis TaxID=8355 RepID=A0A974CZJ8_XENLA|nr:uncharacterized protein XB5732280.S [Xenopus laevis]OCT82318.1 hypothetical protein XELAEV_18024841mg [Xenopus laevis]
MKGEAERQEQYQEFVAYYERKSREGNLTLFDTLDSKGDLDVQSGCPLIAGLGSLSLQVLKENDMGARQQASLLRGLMKGFAILELVCVNLFLYPWRKEIRTLKKFTGNFVYFVAPVIPEHMVKQILQRVGYTVVTDTEYIFGGIVNSEEAKQAAFELFLSRTQCETLIRLIQEGKMDHVQLFLNSEGSSDIKEEPDQEKVLQNSAGNSKTTQEGIHSVQKNHAENKELDLNHTDNVAMPPNPKMHKDVSNACITHDSVYLYSNCSESEEFLNQYSDLNLAQKPIFPKHASRQSYTKTKDNRKDEWVQPVCEESSTSGILTQVKHSHAFDIEGSHIPSSEHVIQETGSDGISESNEIITCTQGLTKKESNHSERLVNKLKLENMVDELLAYPIEETAPPNAESANSNETKNCNANAFNLSRLREPPSSTYIPPGGAERQCAKIIDMHPKENHFQAPSSEDTFIIDQSLFKMNVDPREDFVLITRRENV